MSTQPSGATGGSPSDMPPGFEGGNGRPWPGWLAVSTASVSDLIMLAGLRFDLDRDRYAAGVIETVGWILETNEGPGTGRSEGPQSRAVAWCELCAAEAQALEESGRPAPPLQRVCARLGVRYLPPRTGDPRFGLGAWATLSWALGTRDEEPMRLPLRGADGHLLDVEEILPSVLALGVDPAWARAKASEMFDDSCRLAELVRIKDALRL